MKLQDVTDDKSSLIQVSHYLSQCRPKSVSPYDITWIKEILIKFYSEASGKFQLSLHLLRADDRFSLQTKHQYHVCPCLLSAAMIFNMQDMSLTVMGKNFLYTGQNSGEECYIQLSFLKKLC